MLRHYKTRRFVIMDRLQAPKPLIMEGNLLQNWKLWKQEFNLFTIATEYTEKPEQVKTSLLLHYIGERAREVYNSFTFQSEAEGLNYTKVVEQFEAYFGPRKNVTYS